VRARAITQQRVRTGKAALQALSLRKLESEARRCLDPGVYDFFAGGADDEVTLRANEAAFAGINLVPRVLRGRGQPALDVELLGGRVSMPIIVAPTAFHRLAHPDGECATARAAAGAGTIMIASMASTMAIEKVAVAARERAASDDAGAGRRCGQPNLWFQLYIQPDLGFTEAILQRVEAAGCTTVVVTVDSPAFGHRERDLRSGFLDLPPGMYCENMREPLAEGGLGRVREFDFSPALSWEHVDWLRKTTPLKIALKGVIHPADARIAVERGVDALMVSNHGGRQLDTVPATIELLPEIAEAVGGGFPLVLDGGIRRGTDVVKALALGATAVAIGRPVLWGLALGGEQGVTLVLEMLRAELHRALTLCGCGSASDVRRDLVRRRGDNADTRHRDCRVAPIRR
jgi:4-hydroxymandelate oxidase